MFSLFHQVLAYLPWYSAPVAEPVSPPPSAQPAQEQMPEPDAPEEPTFEQYGKAIDAGDYDLLDRYNELDEGEMFGTVENLLRLTPPQVATLVAYSRDRGNDFTVSFLESYYEVEAIEPFLAYLRLLTPPERTVDMANLYCALPEDKATVLAHPVIKAYLEAYPDDHCARELRLGGRTALRQVLYPDSLSAYSVSREVDYRDQQAVASGLLRQCKGGEELLAVIADLYH
jgi:hypothetical protein